MQLHSIQATLFRLKLPILLAGIAVAAIIALILGFAFPQPVITQWFSASGYYFILSAFGLWMFSLLPSDLPRAQIRAFLHRHGLAFGLAALLSIGAFVISPPKFRILADETNLIGMSAAMYDARSFYNPIEGEYYFYRFEPYTKTWDKRPLLFPFLVSIVHAFCGYSGYHGFVVNGIACWGSLFLFYLLLRRWFARESALFGMTVLAAFPVFILWSTSSGFEATNLCFAILAFLLLDLFLASRDAKYLEMLWLTLILLAQIRYESVLFMLCLAPVSVLFMRRSHYQHLSYRVLLLPGLLLPVAWQRRINLHAGAFEIPAGQPLFSVHRLGQNLRDHAWPFFTGQDRLLYGMIPVVFYLAVIGCGYGLVWLVRHRRSLSARLLGFGAAAIAALLLEGGVVFASYTGMITLEPNIRMGVIFLPFLIAPVILLVDAVIRAVPSGRRYLAVGSLLLFVLYWPVAGQNEAVRHIILHRQYRLVLNFLTKHYPDPNIVIISDRPGLYTIHRWGAVSFGYANSAAATLQDQFQRHLFQDMIVLQQINYADDTPTPDTTLSAAFQVQTLYESQLDPTSYLRISRVLDF